jgi:hypothetical protein
MKKGITVSESNEFNTIKKERIRRILHYKKGLFKGHGHFRALLETSFFFFHHLYFDRINKLPPFCHPFATPLPHYCHPFATPIFI